MHVRFVLGSIVLACAAAGLQAPRTNFTTNVSQYSLPHISEPGGRDSDGQWAKEDPDEYAWQLFFYINRQAELRRAGVPDPKIVKFTDDRPNTGVVWETWALASGETKPTREVFKSGDEIPIAWEDLRKDDQTASPVLTRNLTNPVPNRRAAQSGGLRRRLTVPPPGQTDNSEIRINEESYKTITGGSGIWNQERIRRRIGQSTGDSFVDFPPGSKLTKAVWIRLCRDALHCPKSIKSRYHWRVVKHGALVEAWGLVALHLMSKERSDGKEFWFWADFINSDCLEMRNYPCNRRQALDSHTYIGSPHDSTTVNSKGVRSETKNSQWEHYRLMGTQTDFEMNGQPTYLSDPEIEVGSSDKTSCITCHAYAATTAKPVAGEGPGMCSIDTSKYEPIYGKPNSQAFQLQVGGAGKRCHGQPFHSSDSVWSIILNPM